MAICDIVGVVGIVWVAGPEKMVISVRGRLGSTKVLWVLIRTQFCSFSGCWGFGEGVALLPLAATAAQDLVAVAAGALSSYARSAFTSSWSLSFYSWRTFWLCLISWSSFWVAAMVVVWWRMTSFSVLISFHTSLVGIRPAGSDGAKISPLRVRFRLSTGVLASGSSSVKLAMVSCVFVGGVSGPPAGGSAIRQGLVPRSVHNTAAAVYRLNIDHNVPRCGGRSIPSFANPVRGTVSQYSAAHYSLSTLATVIAFRVGNVEILIS